MRPAVLHACLWLCLAHLQDPAAACAAPQEEARAAAPAAPAVPPAQTAPAAPAAPADPADPATPAAQRPPSVLLIAIDDLNDWVGCLGGHPQARTPHIDRLAARGTLFLNAHCQAPLCNPSRTSLLTGLRPTTTGVYGLAPWIRDVPGFEDILTLPEALAKGGYRTLGGGKVYHGGYPPGADAAREFAVTGPAAAVGARPPARLAPPVPLTPHPLVDWGVFPHRDEDKGDWAVASWAVEQLAANPREPFFLAAGFFLPHVPCYVTTRWWDLFPAEALQLPAVLDRDRDDTPDFSWLLHWRLPEPRASWLIEAGQWRPLVRAYLASIAFVDSQVGRVLDALEASGMAERTVVILLSDHGWHLGEKGITGKNSLWERSTRVPLIMAGPGIARGARSTRPVELLDVYPTIVELAGLAPNPRLEGRSLAPLLKDAAAPWPWPAITSHNQGNHAVRSERWRYIQYADGAEELYDHEADPHEWRNLALDPALAPILAEHRRWLPDIDAPPAPGSAHRILTYDPATGAATWEGAPVPREE